MKVRIAHIVQRLAPGGIETLVLDLLRTGDARDVVYSLEGSAARLSQEWPALTSISDRVTGFEHRGGTSLRLLGRLVGKLMADRPEAVIVHHIGPYLYGGLAARLAGVPVIVHVEHDAWHLDTPRRRTITRVLEKVLRPRHVAVSQSVAAVLESTVPHARITVIPNGIDLARFVPGDRSTARELLGISKAAHVVGSAGRLLPVKGHDLLIRAAAMLSGDVQVVIAGAGPSEPELRALAHDLGVAARVHWLGHRDDLEQILPAFDVFCLPSRSEGLPRSVIEAQACGLPVVATDVGGLREALCGDTGRLVPPDNADALADALREALARPASVAARSFVETRFGWNRTLAGYANVAGCAHAA